MSEDNSYGFWCKHDYQIVFPKERLEQCIHCSKIRSFPHYPYTLGEHIKEDKLKKQREDKDD